MSTFHRIRRNGRRNYIEAYEFSAGLRGKLREELGDTATALTALDGLRAWYLACLYADGDLIGMPSKVVDVAWHEMILRTREYTEFCERAFGGYLHHSPDSTLDVPSAAAAADTLKLVDEHELPMVLFTADGDTGYGSEYSSVETCGACATPTRRSRLHAAADRRSRAAAGAATRAAGAAAAGTAAAEAGAGAAGVAAGVAGGLRGEGGGQLPRRLADRHGRRRTAPVRAVVSLPRGNDHAPGGGAVGKRPRRTLCDAPPSTRQLERSTVIGTDAAVGRPLYRCAVRRYSRPTTSNAPTTRSKPRSDAPDRRRDRRRHRREHPLRDQDLTGRGHLAQPLGQQRRRADRRVLPAPLGADPADRRVAQSDRRPPATVRSPRRVQPSRELPHGGRAAPARAVPPRAAGSTTGSGSLNTTVTRVPGQPGQRPARLVDQPRRAPSDTRPARA